MVVPAVRHRAGDVSEGESACFLRQKMEASNQLDEDQN
jgi:hypothetical protein